MPQKIGMLLTYTNRTALPALQKPEQPQKPVAQQKPVAPQKPAPIKIGHNTHSMRTIIRTPGKSCSSCGH
jgi:hypothetical protein